MDRQDFEELALAELDAVYRFARFLTRDQEAAEDLVQEVYLRAFRPETIAGFSTRGAGVRAWLMTIARNAYYGRLERQETGRKVHERLVHDQRAAGELGDAPADPYGDRDPSAIDWRAAGPRLEAALAALSDELRDVVWFWAVEGLKYREIAAALDVPIGTVMSRLHRARSRLAALLLDDPAAAPELGRVGVTAASHGPPNPRGARP